MIRFGVTLIIIAAILWIIFFLSALFIQAAPNEGIIYSAIIIGIIGTVLALIGVGRDRYQEIKEDKENNDYRKY